MGSLDRAEAVVFEEHYVACAQCASIVENTNRYVRGMKAAAARLRHSPQTPSAKKRSS